MSDPSLIKAGEEVAKKFKSRITHKFYIQYDYRDFDGELFSCIANSIEDARKRRDEWGKNKENLGY